MTIHVQELPYLRNFYFTVIKHHDLGNLEKKAFDLGLTFSEAESVTLMVGSIVASGHGTGAIAENLNPYPHI